MTHKTAWAIVVMVSLAAPTLVFAKPYGMAGCGLGSLAMGKDGSQSSAATTNGTFGSQTFGITSGTSNCSDDESRAALDQEAYIRANFASLAKDAAAGQGQYLAALSMLLGCKGEAKATLFAQTKAHHDTLFTAEADAAVLLERIKTLANSDATLHGGCSRIQ